MKCSQILCVKFRDSSESEKKVMNQQQSLRDKVEEELPKVETSKRKQEDDAGLALDIKK